MKVSELTGALLDWWVANIEGLIDDPKSWMYQVTAAQTSGWPVEKRWSPSTDWSIGGPIIDRERIELRRIEDAMPMPVWEATCRAEGGGVGMCDAQTALEAAMRAYVASKYGVEVPDEVTR